MSLDVRNGKKKFTEYFQKWLENCNKDFDKQITFSGKFGQDQSIAALNKICAPNMDGSPKVSK